MQMPEMRVWHHFKRDAKDFVTEYTVNIKYTLAVFLKLNIKRLQSTCTYFLISVCQKCLKVFCEVPKHLSPKYEREGSLLHLLHALKVQW